MSVPPKVSEIHGLPALALMGERWRPEYADLMERDGLTALSVQVAGDDLRFLRSIRDLRGLVLTAFEARDLGVLEGLTHLQHLGLRISKRARLKLDFTGLPDLRTLMVDWNPGFEGLAACTKLEQLIVSGPPDSHLGRFSSIASLRHLDLYDGRRLNDTRGAEQLPALARLGLYLQVGLERLTGLGAAPALRELNIDTCKKLTTLDEISGLTGLTRIRAANCGEIASLAPLERMQELEDLVAGESTNVIDGDLSVLTRLPRLRKVAMKSRRHYAPSVQEVQQILVERDSQSRSSQSCG